MVDFYCQWPAGGFDLFSSFVFMLVAGATVALLWVFSNWRSPFVVERQILIDASPDRIWEYLANADASQELHDKELIWQFGKLGTTKSVQGKKLVLERQERKDAVAQDRLLKVEYLIQPDGEKMCLHVRHSWGPRSITGRFIAHADAAAFLARFKALCETGSVKTRQALWSRGWIALASALASLAALGVLTGWLVAGMLLVIMIVHELGHLVSFRMVGQPWGRIVFLPFIGAVAVSRAPHLRLSHDVFCALMGAGLSLILLIPALYFYYYSASGINPAVRQMAFAVAALAGGLNVINLLPVFPLDGGRVLRAILQSLSPLLTRPIMYGLSAAVIVAAIYWRNPIIAALGIITFFQKNRLGRARAGLVPMNAVTVTGFLIAYAGLIGLHGHAMLSFWQVFSNA